MVSHGHTVAMPDPVTAIRGLRDHAEVWVLDPRRTETARLATRHLAPRPGTDYAVLAFLVRELLRDGADPDVLARRPDDTDRLAAAVEPFTLGHTARVADVRGGRPDDLLDGGAAGRAGGGGDGHRRHHGGERQRDRSGSPGLVMIITGSMNRPGGAWFHPGFSTRSSPSSSRSRRPRARSAPGPTSRPETQAFLGEWPCAVLADEIRAGNIRGRAQPRRHLSPPSPTPTTSCRRSRSSRCSPPSRSSPTTRPRSVDPRAADEGPARAGRRDAVGLPQPAHRGAAHAGRWSTPVGDRRSTWWVLAELGRRLGHDARDTTGDDATDDAMLARIGSRGPDAPTTTSSPTASPRPAATSRPRGWTRHVDRMGGWRLAPQLLVDQLEALEADQRRSSSCPRRQVRHLNSQLTYLGDPADVVLHPTDAAAAGVTDGQAVVVRSGAASSRGAAQGRSGRTGRRGVGAPRPPRRQRQPAHRQGRHRPRHGHGPLLGHPRHRRAGGGAVVVCLTTSSGGTARCCSRASPATIDSTSSTARRPTSRRSWRTVVSGGV